MWCVYLLHVCLVMFRVPGSGGVFAAEPWHCQRARGEAISLVWMSAEGTKYHWASSSTYRLSGRVETFGRRRWKRQQESRWIFRISLPPPAAQINHRRAGKKNITSPPKGAGLRRWAAPTEGWFSRSVRVEDKCLTYLWIVEKRSVCAALTNDERQKALPSPLTVSFATHQEKNSFHKCTFTWLFHSLRLSGCVLKHAIIVFCCLFRSKNNYPYRGLLRCQKK